MKLLHHNVFNISLRKSASENFYEITGNMILNTDILK